MTIASEPSADPGSPLSGIRGFAVCYMTGCLFGLPDHGFPRSFLETSMYCASVALVGSPSGARSRTQGFLKLVAFAPWGPYLAWTHPRTGFYLWILWLGWAMPCLAFALEGAGLEGVSTEIGARYRTLLQKVWPRVGWVIAAALVAGLAFEALDLVARLPLLRDGVVAQGTVVGFDPADIVLPEIEFRAADGRSLRFTSQLKSHGLEVGSEVEVLHLPSDPTIAEVRSRRLWLQPLFALLILVGVLYLAFGHVPRWAARKPSRR